MDSINKWKLHSNSTSFTQAFDAITSQYKNDNNLRTIKIEEFLLQEAKKAGVVRTFVTKIQKNPNRWAKHLAPWFEESCKEAKQQYRQLKRNKGKKHPLVRAAYQEYKNKCRK